MSSFITRSVRQCSAIAPVFALVFVFVSSRARAFEPVPGRASPVLTVEHGRFILHYREHLRDGVARYFKRTYRRDGRAIADRQREDSIDGQYVYDTARLPLMGTSLPPEFRDHELDRVFEFAWLGGSLVVLGMTKASNSLWMLAFRGSGKTVPVKHLLGAFDGMIPDATSLQCDEKRCLAALRTSAGIVVASLRADSVDVLTRHTLADSSSGGHGVTLAVLGQDILVAYQVVKSATQGGGPTGVIQVRHLSLPLRNR